MNIPNEIAKDVERYESEALRHLRGETPAERFKVFRVPFGIYEQRERGTFMMRIRLPAGRLTSAQMRAVAALAKRISPRPLHVTTRQDLQIHAVRLEDTPGAMKELLGAGLVTRGGGGNTVRNVTACPLAGVCPEEVFDVSRYAVVVTEALVRDPRSWELPRKFKIAFSGCARDCALATVNDVGFVARRGGDVAGSSAGFSVYAAGGMGAISRVADLLEPFVPAADAAIVAEAMKRVFHAHGDRKNRHKARLRFFAEKAGLGELKRLYLEEKETARRDGIARIEQGPASASLPAPARVGARGPRPASSSSAAPEGASPFERWKRWNVREQKQSGFHIVDVPLPLGDIAPEAFAALAEIADGFGGGDVRTSRTQGLSLRWIKTEELAPLQEALESCGLADMRPPVLKNLTVCAGATTCQLGICLSRALATEIVSTLSSDGIYPENLGEVAIKVSGCANSCGQHPIGEIGLHGVARRVDGRLIPHYQIQLDGHAEAGHTRLASGAVTVPSRAVPAVLRELLLAYGARRAAGRVRNFGEFVADGAPLLLRQIAERVGPEAEKNPYDWGSTEPFSLAGRGAGECGAGVMDLVKMDLEGARARLAEAKQFLAAAAPPAAAATALAQAVDLASRALLVTRGAEAKDACDAHRLFEKHFVARGLVPRDSIAILAAAENLQSGALGPEQFLARLAEAEDLLRTVEELREEMDSSLNFRPVARLRELAQAASKGAAPEAAEPASAADASVASVPATVSAAAENSSADPDQPSGSGDAASREAGGEEPAHSADLRGVPCPLNYVQAKMAMEEMDENEIIRIELDPGKPGQNVLASLRNDGQEVLNVDETVERILLTVRKAV